MPVLELLLQPRWALAIAPAIVLALAVIILARRRAEVREYARSLQELSRARESGSHQARLQHPAIDLSRCIGCGACVRACPEDEVLSLLHGQAVVVHGARCVGHGLCADACPTGAIALTLGDLSDRRDLPAVRSDFETVGAEGLFLAGELVGFALVRTAISQGIAVADTVAKRIARSRADARGVRVGITVNGGRHDEEGPEARDLLIVGAGPGGLACSLRATELGIDFVTIEQETRIGGTVAAYPRRKMVMTQPVALPLHGPLPRLTYQKEELVELWEHAAREHALPIRTGVRLLDLKRGEDGCFTAETSAGAIRARNVCLALGRRGTPRKLGVPGEELPKVAYGLIDAESFTGRQILVVGGGDSAIEAALGLAEQPGNIVSISYRRKAFSRLKARNEARIQKAIRAERIGVLFESEVVEIGPSEVRLRTQDGVEQSLPNDDVFVLAGGEPPFALLERAGVSFDPKDRPPPPEIAERGSGLLWSLSLALALTLALFGWAAWFRAYYSLEPGVRAASSLHPVLRPGGPLGLAFGVLGCGLFAWNLLYLVRRSPKSGRWLPGTLRQWMSAHVFTGLLAFLCVIAHSGFAVRPTVGGHALLALAVVIATGSLGRYLYAFIPRAANGTEVSLNDLRSQLAAVSADWDLEGRGLGAQVRDEVEHLITVGRWQPGLLARIGVLFSGQVRLRRSLRRLRRHAVQEGVPERDVRRVLMLARRAYGCTLLVAHYEEVRALLSSWRYFHRWLGVLLVLLAALHIATAVRYANLDADAVSAVWGEGR